MYLLRPGELRPRHCDAGSFESSTFGLVQEAPG
jgi:hypothetical protein